eukprot:gene2322-2865_t
MPLMLDKLKYRPDSLEFNKDSIILFCLFCDSLEMFKLIFNQQFKCFNNNNNNNGDIIDYIYPKSPQPLKPVLTYKAMDLASLNGKLQVVKFLYENTKERFIHAIDYSAMNGHLDVLKYLHNTVTGPCSKKAMNSAATYGYLDIVEFLHFNRTEGCTTIAMDNACQNNFLDVVKFLHFNRTEGCTYDAMDLAASKGTEGCTKSAIDLAARSGHLDIIKFLSVNRTEGCTKAALGYAIQNGYTEIVKYLDQTRTEGCDARDYDAACYYGHLSMVKYLHTYRSHHGKIGFSVRAIELAAKNNHEPVVRFLLEHRTEGFTQRALNFAKGKIADLLYEYSPTLLRTDHNSNTGAIYSIFLDP